MSRTTHSRRPLQRLGLVGVGSAILFVGIAPAASAATNVVIPLEPGAVELVAVPVENFGGTMDPMADPTAFTPVAAEYGDTLTVNLPAELDSTGAEVELVFDNDGDGTPEKTYSTATGATYPLTVSGVGTNTIQVTLPADDTINGPLAALVIEHSCVRVGIEGSTNFGWPAAMHLVEGGVTVVRCPATSAPAARWPLL